MAYQFTPGQLVFIQRFSQRTGLDRNVVSAWVYSEENGSAAASRQSQGNHDWLNIGYTDSGQRGTGFAAWRNPITAADASAAWLQGKLSVPGFGYASKGVQSIAASSNQIPILQVDAIKGSGWASSGYPHLVDVYYGIAGSGSVASTINSAARHIPGVAQAEGAVSAVSGIGGFIGRLTDPSYILRGLQVVAGGVLVLVGVVLLARQVALAADLPDPIQSVPAAKAANALT